MANDTELKQLKRISRELAEIRDRTADPRRAFANGILAGAGWFLGSILAVTFLGWMLSVAGVIPGLNTMVERVQAVVHYER